MLKVTTKRTTVILLALVMSLGLFVAAYGTDSTVNVTISPTVNLDSPPSISTWNMTPYTTTDITNTTPGGTATVTANAPYTLDVKVSSTGDGDQYMTGNSTSLQNAFQLKYDTSNSSVTSPTNTMTLENVTTTGGTKATVVKEATAPDSGSDSIGVSYSQVLTSGDPAYSGDTQINYSIILEWTVSNTV